MKTDKQLNLEAEESAYHIFAQLHPIECYDLDPIRFSGYMRSQGYNITDQKLAELINESR